MIQLNRWRGSQPLRTACAAALSLSASAGLAQAQYNQAQYNQAQYTQPTCNCGPSALPAYIPAPQPARRPLDNSPRGNSGVTVRDGAIYRPVRTDLGASASQTYVGPALWSGFYAGVQGGYSAGTGHINDPGLGDIASRGWFGGAHLGYLAQRGSVVFGIEGDFNSGPASGARSFAAGVETMSDRNWTSSVRGRLGYAVGNAFVYGAAGAAFAEHELTAVNGGLTSTGKTVFPGFVVGGGVDWKVTNNVSLRGEVLQYRFGTRHIDVGGVSVPTKLDETVVRAGVSYHFN